MYLLSNDRMQRTKVNVLAMQKKRKRKKILGIWTNDIGEKKTAWKLLVGFPSQ